MKCPKCSSKNLTSKESFREKSVNFHSVKIQIGVHPHAILYGVPPDAEFYGTVWNCENCNFEFYTKQGVDEEEIEKSEVASIS